MKVNSIVGYALGFGLIAICAILAGDFSEKEQVQESRQHSELTERRRIARPSNERFLLQSDTDGDGFLSKMEYLASRYNHEISDRAILFYLRVYERMDLDHDNRIDEKHFTEYMRQLAREYDKLWKKTVRLNVNRDLELSREETEPARGGPYAFIFELFDTYDLNHDGAIQIRGMEFASAIYLQLVVPDWIEQLEDPQVIASIAEVRKWMLEKSDVREGN